MKDSAHERFSIDISQSELKSIDSYRGLYGNSSGLLVPPLLGIVGRNRRGVINLDATPLLVFAVVEGQLPATLILWCAQPQPHQVSARRWWRVVLVCCPGVQDVVVGQELDVTNVQDHVQSEAQAGLVKDGSGAELLGRKRRDDALVAEAGQGLDVVWIPPNSR